MAFWIMTAVTLSGFIGRYLYSQIPRSLNAAELSIKEIQEMEVKLRWEAEEKHEKIGTYLIELVCLAFGGSSCSKLRWWRRFAG